MDAVGVALIAVAMAVGLIGTVIPLVPGLPIIWAAALVYGIAAGFGTTGWIAFGAITILLVGGVVAGLVLPHRRVASKGAPPSTVLAGVVGGIVGFFVIPVVGLIVGAVAGVLVAERIRLPDWGAAWAATKNLLIGFGIGAAVEFGAGVLMVGCWVAWVVLD